MARNQGTEANTEKLRNSWERQSFCTDCPNIFFLRRLPIRNLWGQQTTLFPSPSPSFVCSSDSFSTFVSFLLDVKTNTRTPGWQGDGGTRGKVQPSSAPRRRAPGACGAGPSPRARARRVPERLRPGGRAGGGRRARRAAAAHRVQSAFCECTRVIREKWIIVARARSAPSHAMLGPIGSTSRVFTHIRVREEKRKVSFKPELKTFTMKSHSGNRPRP